MDTGAPEILLLMSASGNGEWAKTQHAEQICLAEEQGPRTKVQSESLDLPGERTCHIYG